MSEEEMAARLQSLKERIARRPGMRLCTEEESKAYRQWLANVAALATAADDDRCGPVGAARCVR